MIIKLPATLRHAMKQLSQSGEGVLFLTSDNELVGSITDGDIRRALLQEFDLDASVELIANKQPKTLSENSSPVEVHQAFNKSVRFVPVVNQFGNILRIISREQKTIIPLAEPNLSGVEIELVNEALNSNWISSSGSYVKEFEELFAKYTGATNALTVSNGTLGLVLAMKVLGIEPGDEVIVPTLTFGATANAVIQIGAIPVFADSSPIDMNVDLEQVRSAITKKTRAIIVVHLYGSPVDLEGFRNLANEFDLILIEDAAEAIGSRINGEHVGIFGDAGVFSFFANKTITTGEGGMIVFRDDKNSDQAKMMRSHGFSPQNRYWHEIWGTNMRITNLQAAIGVGQMGRVDELVQSKIRNAAIYIDTLAPLRNKGLIFPTIKKGFTNSHWLFVLRFLEDPKIDELISFLSDNHIEARRIFTPLHRQPAFSTYQKSKNEFASAEKAFQNGICLPSSTKLKPEEIQRICYQIMEYVNN